MNTLLKSIAIAFSILVTSTGTAQESKTIKPSGDTRENFKFGFKAGVNLSNVYDEDGNDFVAENKVGFVGGVFISIPITKYIGFQPEFLYSQKGFKATGSTILGDYDYNRTTTYLDIPLQLQIKPLDIVTVLVGPQYSYLLETKNEFNGTSNTAQEDDINGDNYKKNIFGFAVGADLNLNPFVISVRGSFDLTKSDTDGDDTNPRYKNQVLQLTLGYAF
jgi:hypothetical protein